jgi:hypothetical protein
MNIRSAFSISAAMQMALLVLTASVLFSQDSDSNTAKSLPTAQQVMDRYVTALGGRDSIFEHKSMTVRGTFEVSEKGPRLDRSAYYKSGKMLYEVTLPNGSRYQEGYDGTVAWQLHPQSGAALSEGKEVKSKQRDADMYYPAHVLDYFRSMEVVGVTDFEGHTCYHLKGTNQWGIVNEQFYDTSTGLLTGYRFNSAWRGGVGEEIEVFSDYKAFDGWLMPTRDAHKSADGLQVQTTSTVTFDDVSDSVFALPGAIKALLAKKGAN